MHELSIAMSLVEVATEEAQRLTGRVTAVHVKLGLLSGVVKEALLSAYTQASAGSLLEGSRLVIVEMPIVAWCPTCNREQKIKSIQEIVCPACRTPTPKLLGGRELEVTALEVVDLDQKQVL